LLAVVTAAASHVFSRLPHDRPLPGPAAVEEP
jgi:hypothetical protein